MAIAVPLEPVSGFKPIKTLADVRNLIHNIVMLAVPLLVLIGVGTEQQILGWVAVGFAAIDPILSFTNTYDGIRKVIYGLGGLSQTGLIAFGVASEIDVTQYAGAVISFLVAVVGQFYTPTSTLQPVYDPPVQTPRVA